MEVFTSLAPQQTLQILPLPCLLPRILAGFSFEPSEPACHSAQPPTLWPWFWLSLHLPWLIFFLLWDGLASLWAPDHSPLLSIAMFRKPHLPRLIHLLEQSLGPGGYTAKLGLESHGHPIVAVDGHCDPQHSHQDYRELGTFAPKERGTAGHTKSVATPALEGPLASGNRIWGDRIMGGKNSFSYFVQKQTFLVILILHCPLCWISIPRNQKNPNCYRSIQKKAFLHLFLIKKGDAKECSNYCTTALISHVSKVMLKIGLNSTWSKNFQMYRLDLEKAEEPEIKLPTSPGS